MLDIFLPGLLPRLPPYSCHDYSLGRRAWGAPKACRSQGMLSYLPFMLTLAGQLLVVAPACAEIHSDQELRNCSVQAPGESLHLLESTLHCLHSLTHLTLIRPLLSEGKSKVGRRLADWRLEQLLQGSQFSLVPECSLKFEILACKAQELQANWYKSMWLQLHGPKQ